MIRLFGLIFLLMLGWLGPALSAHAERIALVVGISAYRHAPPLANPSNDADLMARTLQELGFRVTRLIDADKDSLKRAMLEFGRSLRSGQTEAGLFYFAGHGVQAKGENYLIPVDASIANEDEIELEAINVNAFLAVMESSQSAVNIVILDACRNNPFAASSRSAARGLAAVDAPKGTYIAYATSPGAVALDGDDGNSPYTRALAEAMREPGAPIERVFKNARVQVLAATSEQQLPWETSSITGDFFFAGPVEGTTLPQADNRPSPAQQQPGQQEKLSRLELPQTPSNPSPAWPGEICSANASLGSICASSVLDPQFGNRYGPGNLMDGNPATAWVEGAGGDGKGEAFVIRFVQPMEYRRIRIMNGYNKNDDIFTKNNRPRIVVLTESGGRSFDVEMLDAQGWQTIELPETLRSDWVSLSLNTVYRGTRYRDTAISEIEFE